MLCLFAHVQMWRRLNSFHWNQSAKKSVCCSQSIIVKTFEKDPLSTPCHSCHTTPHHATPTPHITSRHTTPHATPRHATPRHTTQCHNRPVLIESSLHRSTDHTHVLAFCWQPVWLLWLCIRYRKSDCKVKKN